MEIAMYASDKLSCGLQIEKVYQRDKPMDAGSIIIEEKTGLPTGIVKVRVN